MSGSAPGRRRPYTRSMTGWWFRNAFFIEYMIHEGTAVFVAAYALVLLSGLVRLSQGQAAWNGWLESLRAPQAITFHVIALVAIAYHSYTWFKIMPRTLPAMFVRGKRVSAATITCAGLAAVVISSIVLLVLAERLGA